MQGKDNSVANTLSRATIDDVQLAIDYGAMATARQQDAEVQAYRTSNWKTSPLEHKVLYFSVIRLLAVLDRPIVPVGWRHMSF